MKDDAYYPYNPRQDLLENQTKYPTGHVKEKKNMYQAKQDYVSDKTQHLQALFLTDQGVPLYNQPVTMMTFVPLHH
ncbi:hypothetical protein ZO25_004942 [Salmonella enterica subsp. enterica]|nr:hypothetical protein [Salmonella enterica subsp. enterica]